MQPIIFLLKNLSNKKNLQRNDTIKLIIQEKVNKIPI